MANNAIIIDLHEIGGSYMYKITLLKEGKLLASGIKEKKELDITIKNIKDQFPNFPLHYND